MSVRLSDLTSIASIELSAYRHTYDNSITKSLKLKLSIDQSAYRHKYDYMLIKLKIIVDLSVCRHTFDKLLTKSKDWCWLNSIDLSACHNFFD